MKKRLPTKKQFAVGEVVEYIHPSKMMTKAFGRRVFLATSETSSLKEEYAIAAEGEGELGPLDIGLGASVSPPDEGCGMILNLCHYDKHGAGTWYYKVLLGDQLYWIASEHLKLAEKD